MNQAEQQVTETGTASSRSHGGIGVATQSPWVLLLTLPLAVVVHYGVVAREEAYLERRFGDAYRDYKARVRRWV
jgi:protein-S-isoprenylcysteine O-methyltransferase Ste14